MYKRYLFVFLFSFSFFSSIFCSSEDKGTTLSLQGREKIENFSQSQYFHENQCLILPNSWAFAFVNSSKESVLKYKWKEAVYEATCREIEVESFTRILPLYQAGELSGFYLFFIGHYKQQTENSLFSLFCSIGKTEFSITQIIEDSGPTFAIVQDNNNHIYALASHAESGIFIIRRQLYANFWEDVFYEADTLKPFYTITPLEARLGENNRIVCYAIATKEGKQSPFLIHIDPSLGKANARGKHIELNICSVELSSFLWGADFVSLLKDGSNFFLYF